jgi:hypothetical protein
MIQTHQGTRNKREGHRHITLRKKGQFFLWQTQEEPQYLLRCSLPPLNITEDTRNKDIYSSALSTITQEKQYSD